MHCCELEEYEPIITFFYQLRMRGTFSIAGVHDLVHGNRPEFVAMAVKQPEVREMCNKYIITLVRVK